MANHFLQQNAGPSDPVPDPIDRRPLSERVDELADFVFRLMTRSNNVERHAGKLEDWYYRLHGQLKAVENSVESLNKWRRRMEAQQAALSPFIRFGTSTWAYEGWQGMVYRNAYAKRRFKQDCLAEYAQYVYRGEPLFRTVGLDLSFYGPPSVELLTCEAFVERNRQGYRVKGEGSYLRLLPASVASP